eukprot:Rhum_TRINITY_DN14467_c21_g1::Rhum_TRINITY_DN14467_c21_g1_i1::g.91824::m.91824
MQRTHHRAGAAGDGGGAAATSPLAAASSPHDHRHHSVDWGERRGGGRRRAVRRLLVAGVGVASLATLLATVFLLATAPAEEGALREEGGNGGWHRVPLCAELACCVRDPHGACGGDGGGDEDDAGCKCCAATGGWVRAGGDGDGAAAACAAAAADDEARHHHGSSPSSSVAAVRRTDPKRPFGSLCRRCRLEDGAVLDDDGRPHPHGASQQQQQQQRRQHHWHRKGNGTSVAPSPTARSAGRPVPSPTGSTTTAAASSSLLQDKLTLVLCTWSGDAEGAPRLGMLLASVRKFMDPASLHEVLLIVPGDEVHLFRKRVAAFFDASPAAAAAAAGSSSEEGEGSVGRPFAVRIIADGDVLALTPAEAEAMTPRGELKQNGGRGANYRRQMLLKLGVARHLRTAFYVTMDNDVFVKRPTTAADLLRPAAKGEGEKGRAAAAAARGLVQGREETAHRRSWWDAAAAVVKAPEGGPCTGASLHAAPFQVGVTPALLSTELAAGFLRYLEAEYTPAGRLRRSFDQVMFERLKERRTADWTEYTLYWAYGCVQGSLGRLHRADSAKRLYDTSAFAWHSFDSYNADRVFADNSTFFGVVQSINGATPAQVLKELSPRFL